MSYLVLARKWRPRTFDDLVGQEPIARILRNAITQQKIAHAYVFSGPRGVGKTTTARILAKAMNCKEGPTISPCGVCDSCRAVTEGSSVDVIEIDGASNNSVDDVRDLRERVKYAPSGGKYKVYIIDEVHMLSGSAFNALLKTLEEPPAHVIFVLATTEMKKIPATVLSRCQHMPFRRIPAAVIKARLKHISDTEQIKISAHALGMVAKAADGSMRDSLTILDQISSFSDEIGEEHIQNLLGLTEFGVLAGTSKALITGDRAELIHIIEGLADQGSDFRAFARELAQFFRDLLVAGVARNPAELLELNDEELASVKELVAAASEDQLTLMLSEMMKAEADVRNSTLPRMALEMALIRASYLSSLKPVKELIENLDRLSGRSAQSAASAVNAAAPPAEVRSAKVPQAVQSGNKEDDSRSAGPEQPAAPEEDGDVEASPITEADDTTAMQESRPLRDVAAALDEGNIRTVWKRVLDSMEAPLASKLEHAETELSGDDLTLHLSSSHALFIDTIKGNLKNIEALLQEQAGRRINISLSVKQKKTVHKKDLKKKAMSDPAVKEALELFEGRIVDVIPGDESEITTNGGDDV